MHISKPYKIINVIIMLLLTMFLGVLGAQLYMFHTTNAEDGIYIDINLNFHEAGPEITYYIETGWNRTLMKPTREGFEFIDWMIESGDDSPYSKYGTLLFPNPFFDTPHTADKQDNLQLYNNAENGTVTITNVPPDPYLGFGAQKNMIKISNTGSARPGLGGFATPIQSYPGGRFTQVVFAKIPVGYTLEFASNSIGDGGTHRFVTSQQGTGNWELYQIYHQSGTTGNFSTCGYFYLDGQAGRPEKPVDWYVAYAGSYDTSKAKYPDTVTAGTKRTKLRALWKENSWAVNYTVPVKNAQGIYEVSKASELGYFAYKSRIGEVSDSIMLTKDINMAGHDWTPIGSSNNYDFSGKFNGNGYTISNMKTSILNPNCVGLFGFVDTNSVTWEQPIIENVNLKNAIVRGKESVGGIAGFAWRAIIRNCTFAGSISATGSQVGGIVGIGCHNTEVSGCLVSANLKGLYYIGGIMGLHEHEATSLKKNYFTGSINGTKYLGGILGHDAGNSMTISNSGVNATLTIEGGDFTTTGGIIGAGAVKITVTDSYFVGDIQAVNGSSNTSTRWNGLIGSWATLVIENVYGRFFTYFNGTLISANGFMYGSTDYTNWSYAPTINNGLPVPAGLFHIGSVGTQNTYQYLVSLGFAKA